MWYKSADQNTPVHEQVVQHAKVTVPLILTLTPNPTYPYPYPYPHPYPNPFHKTAKMISFRRTYKETDARTDINEYLF